MALFYNWDPLVEEARESEGKRKKDGVKHAFIFRERNQEDPRKN